MGRSTQALRSYCLFFYSNIIISQFSNYCWAEKSFCAQTIAMLTYKYALYFNYVPKYRYLATDSTQIDNVTITSALL